MTFCRRAGSTRVAAGRFRTAGALVLAGCLIAVQSPAFAQDIESRAIRTDVRPEASRRDSTAFRDAATATIAGSLFDSVTTIRGITQSNAREANPILGQTPGRIIVMKSLLLVPQLWAEKRLADTGHPKAARLIGFAAGGFAAALALRNIRITTP